MGQFGRSLESPGRGPERAVPRVPWVAVRPSHLGETRRAFFGRDGLAAHSSLGLAGEEAAVARVADGRGLRVLPPTASQTGLFVRKSGEGVREGP